MHRILEALDVEMNFEAQESAEEAGEAQENRGSTRR